MLILLCVVTFITAIIALSFSVKFGDGQSALRCSIITVVDDLVDGT